MYVVTHPTELGVFWKLSIRGVRGDRGARAGTGGNDRNGRRDPRRQGFPPDRPATSILLPSGSKPYPQKGLCSIARCNRYIPCLASFGLPENLEHQGFAACCIAFFRRLTRKALSVKAWPDILPAKEKYIPETQVRAQGYVLSWVWEGGVLEWP